MTTTVTPTKTTTGPASTPTTGPPPTTTVIDGTAYPIPPAPTVLGSTPKCKKWYVAEGGDTCLAISAEFDVTKTQVNPWNTYINIGWRNIWATYAICVSSPMVEEYWSLVGCSTDSQSARGLTNRIAFPNEKSIMTLKICTDACAAAGYRLASLRYGSECYCNNAVRNIHPSRLDPIRLHDALPWCTINYVRWSRQTQPLPPRQVKSTHAGETDHHYKPEYHFNTR